MEAEKDELQKMNPQITDVEIGVRNLRKIIIYPLSVGQQLELEAMITDIVQGMVFKSDGEDLEFISTILKAIRTNIVNIFELITENEDGVKMIADMTNLQLSEIAKIVYEVNYGEPLKNVKGLGKVMELVSLLERQSPQSVKDTDTDLKTSSENDLSKEELPKDN